MKALKLKTLVASMALVAVAVAPELARADNVAFATTDVAVTSRLAAAATSNCGGASGAPFNLILTAQIANSGTPKDLVLGLSAETSIVTVTTVASKGGTKSTAWAEGKIEMCVETVSGDGTKVADPGIITFDRRKQELWAKLAGLNCTADLTTGLVTCTNPEEIGLLLDTTAAHHFNFVMQNPGPGAITVNAYARVTCNKSLDGTTPVPGCENDPAPTSSVTGVTAVIGKASLVAFEVQASNSR